MKVKDNMLNTRSILLSEADTVSRLMLMMTSIIFEESLARDTHTKPDRPPHHTDTHTQT